MVGGCDRCCTYRKHQRRSKTTFGEKSRYRENFSPSTKQTRTKIRWVQGHIFAGGRPTSRSWSIPCTDYITMAEIISEPESAASMLDIADIIASQALKIRILSDCITRTTTQIEVLLNSIIRVPGPIKASMDFIIKALVQIKVLFEDNAKM